METYLVISSSFTACEPLLASRQLRDSPPHHHLFFIKLDWSYTPVVSVYSWVQLQKLLQYSLTKMDPAGAQDWRSSVEWELARHKGRLDDVVTGIYEISQLLAHLSLSAPAPQPDLNQSLSQNLSLSPPLHFSQVGNCTSPNLSATPVSLATAELFWPSVLYNLSSSLCLSHRALKGGLCPLLAHRQSTLMGHS